MVGKVLTLPTLRKRQSHNCPFSHGENPTKALQNLPGDIPEFRDEAFGFVLPLVTRYSQFFPNFAARVIYSRNEHSVSRAKYLRLASYHPRVAPLEFEEARSKLLCQMRFVDKHDAFTDHC